MQHAGPVCALAFVCVLLKLKRIATRMCCTFSILLATQHRALLFPCLQEAQQDTIMSFERYMSDCMSRDWASDKQGLFSSVAPFTGLGREASTVGGLSFGSVARTDVGEQPPWSLVLMLALLLCCGVPTGLLAGNSIMLASK